MVGIEPFNGSYSSWIGLKNKRDIARMSLTCSVRRFGFFNSAVYGWLIWRGPFFQAPIADIPIPVQCPAVTECAPPLTLTLPMLSEGVAPMLRVVLVFMVVLLELTGFGTRNFSVAKT